MHITGGDLYHLWRVSDVHLPRIADVYFDANNRLADAAKETEDCSAFEIDVAGGYNGTVMTSSIGAAWSELRDEMQRMYAQIEDSILTAAKAIRQASDDFVQADLAAGRRQSREVTG